MHSGLLEHQGVAISSGRRLILVGFLRDSRCPLTHMQLCRYDELQVGDVVRLRGANVVVERFERKKGQDKIKFHGRRVRDDRKIKSPFKPPATELKYMSEQYSM